MKKYLFILCLFSLANYAFSQHPSQGISFETDPMTSILGAKTLSIIVEPKASSHWSLFTNIVRADFPSWVDDMINPHNKDKGFQSCITIGGGIGTDYFFSSAKTGFYAGALQLFFRYRITQASRKQYLTSYNLIPRLGYRWYPFSTHHFYINPFMGVRYETLITQASSTHNPTYQAAGFQPFGTIHLGYHF